MMPDITVDASGRPCPLPIIEVAKALRGAPSGALVLLLATDPGIRPDLLAFCQSTGHLLERFEVANGSYRAWLRKVGRP